jgi:hypothetical protein
MTRATKVFIGGLGLSLAIVGVLSGVLLERVRFDRTRLEVRARYDESVRRGQSFRMEGELRAVGTEPSLERAWTRHLRLAREALVRGDLTASEREWAAANVEARRARRSSALAAVGDAAVEIAAAAPDRRPFVARAREAYLTALFRARAEHDDESIRHAAAAFARLGDAATATQALQMISITARLTPAEVGMAVDAEQTPGRAEWTVHLRALDDHLLQGDLSPAVRDWYDARRAALVDPGWDGMLAVGSAALRLGAATSSVLHAETDARDAYMTALYRARRQASLHGSLQAAERLRDLGDAERAAQAVAVARQMLAQGLERDALEAPARVERVARTLQAAQRPDGGAAAGR